jgi:hypothetical protein
MKNGGKNPVKNLLIKEAALIDATYIPQKGMNEDGAVPLYQYTSV